MPPIWGLPTAFDGAVAFSPVFRHVFFPDVGILRVLQYSRSAPCFSAWAYLAFTLEPIRRTPWLRPIIILFVLVPT